MRWVAAALAAVAAALALPSLAAAHAALESSSPAANQSVPTSPRHIVLTFSEAPDLKLSLVKVLDADGAAVSGVSAPQPVPGDKQSLRVTPATPLGDGTYTVNWRVVSSVDGHVESGAFAFGVGRPAGEAVVVPLLHTSRWAGALTYAGRWVLYAALAVLIGAATSASVYGGVLPRGGAVVLRWTVFAAMVALASLTWGEKVLVGAPSLLPLFQTREGQLLLALAVAIGLCAGAVVLADLWPARWSLRLLGVAGATAALVHVAAGHAVSPSSVLPLNLVAQWVHMTAVGIWVGGLLWLLLGFAGRDHEARAAAVAVFTRIATAMLVVVLVTGLARALIEVGSVSALFDTRYGATLVVKVALVAGLVALGALNHLYWVPAVRAGGGPGAERRFGLNSRGELAIALGVLAATAVLSGLAPAHTAAAIKSGAAVRQAGAVTASAHDFATSVRVELTLTPGVAGRNAYILWADDYDTGDPLVSVAAVRLLCSLPSRPSLSPETVELRPAPNGSWTGAGLEFSVAGRWNVQVSIQEKSGGTTVLIALPVGAPSP